MCACVCLHMYTCMYVCMCIYVDVCLRACFLCECISSAY